MAKSKPFDIEAAVGKVLSAPKYRNLGIPEDTIRSLYEVVLADANVKNQKEAEKLVRRKLHNIMATYLGDPDYPELEKQLEAVFAKDDPDSVKTLCREQLLIHASTAERIPLLNTFYQQIFSVTGIPSCIMDLACALHPLSFPWMGLPNSVEYHAYDIHQPRVSMLNHFFELQGMRPLVEVRDILVDPPQLEADVAFFFKEAHRFEKREPGCNRAFFKALKVRFLVVSLPTMSLHGNHDLLETHRKLVYRAIDRLDWPVTEILFNNEIVFCIEKNYGKEA
jgi:16S rRNA (guanine(1405)-N(7))-methyltransferase